MNAHSRLHKAVPLEAPAPLPSRHPVDRLALVRAQIKALQDEETRLKSTIEGMMGTDEAIGGDEYIATRINSNRKGGLDEDGLRRAGIDLERYRKPSTAVTQLRVVQRVVEEV